MPGVPRSRGCYACRRQKKGGESRTPWVKHSSLTLQCDLKSPACDRCRRLDIVCQGMREPRYIFMHMAQQPSQSKDTSQRTSRNNSTEGSEQSCILHFSPTPANDLTRLTTSFIRSIDPTTDVKYQLLYTFGGYLAEIPCRLGTNEALDASARALVVAYEWYCTGSALPSFTVSKSFSKALRALRLCLEEPAKAQSSETLCAIMIIMIVQVGRARRWNVQESTLTIVRVSADQMAAYG